MLSKLPTCPFAGSSLCPKCPLLNHLSLKKNVCIYIYLFLSFGFVRSQLQQAGSSLRGKGLVAVTGGLRCPTACGILAPNQASNRSPWTGTRTSQPLDPQGSPHNRLSWKLLITWTLTQCHGPQKAFPPARKKRTPAPLAIECTLLCV